MKLNLKFKFDNKTRLKKVYKFILVYPELIEKSKEFVKDKINPKIFDFFGMTVLEFLNLQQNILPKKLEKFLSKRKTTFVDYIKVINTFDKGAKDLEFLLNETIIKGDVDSEHANNGLLQLTMEETMLDFLKDYFKLQNFDQAQKITLYEYITARKVAYNKHKFEQNLIEIQKIKHKTH